MENTKISAVSTAKTTKHGWLTRGSRLAKKAIMSLTIFGCMASMCATQASAWTVLYSVCCLMGAGVVVWCGVNLLEGYGNDNPGAKSQGMKQLMSGLGLILLAIVLVPVLQNMMTGAG